MFAPARSSAASLAALLTALLCVASLAAPARAEIETLDEGKMIVFQKGKAMRVEEFRMDRDADTLVVRAQSFIASEAQKGGQPDKVMALEVGALDYAFVRYQSQHVVGTDTLRRGVETTPGDTVFTVWRELNNHGVGDRLVLPPGRLYVLDPPLFTTFAYVARTLHGSSFDRRPIQMLVLSAPDTMVEVTVTDRGSETIRWGGRPVVTRKLLLADQRTRFTAWVAPDGRMLKLEQVESGIVVERQAPPVKRRAPRPK